MFGLGSDLPLAQPLPTFDVGATHPDLTFILHKMNTQCSPISDRKQVPAFFVTWPLLTCNTSHDPDPKRVITVTGTLAAEASEALKLHRASSLTKTLPARAMFLNSAYNRLRSRVGHLRRW